MMNFPFVRLRQTMKPNGPGIATVADLRASSLSAVIRPKRGSEPEIASKPAIVAIPC